MDREIFFFSSSMAVIFASTIWPQRYILGLLDTVIGNLGNVNQAVNAGNHLGKGTEGISLTTRTSATSPTPYLFMNTCQGSML